MNKLGSANDAWFHTVSEVLRFGKPVSPQNSTGAEGRISFEILNHSIAFDMHYPIVTIKPKTSWSYMASEALWVLDGSLDLKYNPTIERIQAPYSDDGLTLRGAYGPWWKHQKDYLLRTLIDDSTSRQAVMTIWKSIPTKSKDIPCTIAIQFIVRDTQLHTLVTMRSSDVGKGLPYDMFTFACMGTELASELSVEVGTCYITAGSRHIYMDQMDTLNEVYEKFRDAWIEDPYTSWDAWKWTAIKEKLRNISLVTENKLCKELLLKVSG